MPLFRPFRGVGRIGGLCSARARFGSRKSLVVSSVENRAGDSSPGQEAASWRRQTAAAHNGAYCAELCQDGTSLLIVGEDDVAHCSLDAALGRGYAARMGRSIVRAAVASWGILVACAGCANPSQLWRRCEAYVLDDSGFGAPVDAGAACGAGYTCVDRSALEGGGCAPVCAADEDCAGAFPGRGARTIVRCERGACELTACNDDRDCAGGRCTSDAPASRCVAP